MRVEDAATWPGTQEAYGKQKKYTGAPLCVARGALARGISIPRTTQRKAQGRRSPAFLMWFVQEEKPFASPRGVLGGCVHLLSRVSPGMLMAPPPGLVKV